MILKKVVFYLSSLLGAAAYGKITCPKNGMVPSASSLIDNGLAALGGKELGGSITGVTYQTPSYYRSQTLMENYDMFGADRYVATVGHQTISFSFSDNGILKQRIDRVYEMSEFWFWASPLLEPRDYTLVLQSGADGYACFTKGNNQIGSNATAVQGYVEAPLAEYYVYQAFKLSPNLLSMVRSSNDTSSCLVTVDGVQMPAVHDAELDVTVIFDPSSHLPYIIRSYEDNSIFGPSTSDLQVYNYTSVDGMMFPQRFVWLYNGAVLEDFLVSNIIADYVADYFDGLPTNTSGRPRAAPQKNPDYAHAELAEYSSNMLWRGEYAGTLGNLSAINPISNLPHLWFLVFMDSPVYQQWVIEFEDAVIVADAPPHQNTLVLEWVHNTLKKNVTHLWLSHHHHDHSYGALEYVQAGAKLIVPEVARSYWSNLPNVELISYDDRTPYIHKDSNMQARFIWENNAPHAKDWSYGMVTSACPSSNETVAVFEADVWSPNFPEAGIDQALSRQWLDQAVADGLPKNALVTAAHGGMAPLADLINFLGYPYPNYTTADWKKGGPLC